MASNTRLGRTTNKKEKLSVAREVSISARTLLTCLDIIRQAIPDIVRLKVMEMPTKRMMTVKSPHRIYIYAAEIGLNGLIKAGVKLILDKVNFKDTKSTNTGYRSAATVVGKDSVAIVTGRYGRARGALGCWIVLTERGGFDGETYPIKEVKAFKVDGVNIKENAFYRLVDGKPVEVEQ